ncbi:hypothetical protein GQ457_01G040650 [Hibiscus cannabinus]
MKKNVMNYLQKNSLTDCCHDSTSISNTKVAASPHDEPPIPSTDVGSGDGLSQPLPPSAIDEEDDDELVLMAIISPAKTIGRTNPELSFVSCFLPTYNGDRTRAASRANAMATPLWGA